MTASTIGTTILNVNGSSSSFTTGLLNIVNTNTAPQESAFILAPNMTQTTSANGIVIGQSASANNSFMIQYNHVTAGSTTNYLSIYPYSAGGGFLCLNAAGNVGIGTTAPAGNVSIYGSSYPSIIIQDSVNTSEYITMFRDHIANISLIRATGRIDIETPPNYNRMTILGNGNVGIGKTIPTAALDVTGSLFINNGAVATSPSAFQGMQMAYVGTGSTGYGYILCTNPGATWNSLCLNPFGGNVGIGLTNPSSKLDVAGAINCTSFLVNGTAVATGTGSVWGVNGSSAYYTSGNVGIGTINPTASLHINNASGNRINMLYLSSIQSGIVLDSTASSNGRSYNIWSTNGSDSVGSGCLAFFDMIASAYRMVINPSGNVGIGTNNPASILTLNNNSAAFTSQLLLKGKDYYTGTTGTSGTGFAINLGVNNGGNKQLYLTDPDLAINTTNSLLNFTIAGTQCFIRSLSTDGTTALPVYMGSSLLSAGDGTSNLGASGYRFGAVFAVNGTIQTSDSSEKDLTILPYGLTELMQMKTIMYKWKSQALLPDTDPAKNYQYYGVCADQLSAIFPELVYNEDPSVPMQLNYSEIIPVVVKAVQEQNIIVKEQATEITALQSQLTKVLSQIAILTDRLAAANIA
jgi:hypothetical protein